MTTHQTRTEINEDTKRELYRVIDSVQDVIDHFHSWTYEEKIQNLQDVRGMVETAKIMIRMNMHVTSEQ